MQSWIVVKFGGTSVADAKNWPKIANIVQNHIRQGKQVLVVHSALSGVSNVLTELSRPVIDSQYKQVIKGLLEKHQNLANDLDVALPEAVKSYHQQLTQWVEGIQLLGEASPRTKARILSSGEYAATRIGATYLQESLDCEVAWVDAGDCLQAAPPAGPYDSNAYVNAKCDFEADTALAESLQQKARVIVTQGFIARNTDGDTVVLGRGGSDTSAAYFAAKLMAEKLEIWTDVPGMFTANPHLIPTARLLTNLSYDEAQEIASTGGKVLHPAAIRPARVSGIAMDIRCTGRPSLPGTQIHADSLNKGHVKAISMRSGLTLVSMETVGMWQQVGFLADAFTCFKDLGLSIDLVSTSESNVTVSLDMSTLDIDSHTMDRLHERLSRFCRVKVIQDCAAVSLVGRQVRAILHRLAPAFDIFREQKVLMLTQAANDLNFTFVVESDQANRVVQRLHELLIADQQDPETFGPSWTELFGQHRDSQSHLDRWWRQHSDQLIKLAEEGPAYVYAGFRLDQSAEKLKKRSLHRPMALRG